MRHAILKLKKVFSFLSSRFLYFAFGVVIAISIYAVQAAWDTTVADGTPLTPTLWNDLVAKIQELDGRAVLTGNSATISLPAGPTYSISIWGSYFTCEDFSTSLRLDGVDVKSYSGAGTDSAGCDQNIIMTKITGIAGGSHTLSLSRGSQWDFMWTAVRE